MMATLAVAEEWGWDSALEVALVGRAVQPGEVVRVDVVCQCGTRAPHASVFDRNVSFALSADGTRWQGFVGIDLGVAAGTYSLVIELPDRPPDERHEVLLQVEPKRFRTRMLRVAPEFVDPPAPLLDRITREAALIDTVISAATPRAPDRSVALPLASQPTPNFGWRSVFNGKARNPHAGIDFSSASGTVVTAPAAGTVALAADLFFTGNTVILDHGAGLYSLLAHLSSITVGPGDIVDRGRAIGRVGATGRATGPHLHWSVRLNGARVDPLSLVAAADDTRTPLAAPGGR